MQLNPTFYSTPGPIHFHATKYGAVVAPSITIQNELKNDVHTYLLPQTPKNNMKTDEHDLKYAAPEVPKDNAKTDIQRLVLNYILHEEHKNGPGDDVLKHDWTLQQFPQSETWHSYAPVSSNEKTKLALPNSPVTSAVSWPMETKDDVPMMPPVKSEMAPDGTTSNSLPLGTT